MNIAKGFIPGRTIPETLFSGHVRFTYFVPDGSIFFQCELGPGHIREFPFDEASIIGRYAADSLTFSRIFLNGAVLLEDGGTLSPRDARRRFNSSFMRAI